MKHLTKKISLAGGKGSKPKPKPAQLNPPVLGEHQLVSSFSYAEILDLISDGPIAGLVNKEGVLVKGKDILQGIYLDGTPVTVTNETNQAEEDKLSKFTQATDTDFETTIAPYFSDLLSSSIQNTYSALYPDSNYKLVYANNEGDISTVLPNLFTKINSLPQEGEYSLEEPEELFLNINRRSLGLSNDDTILTWYQNILDQLLVNSPTALNGPTQEFFKQVVANQLGDDVLTNGTTDPFKNWLLEVAGYQGKVKPIAIIKASNYIVYNTDDFLDSDGEVNYDLRIALKSTFSRRLTGRYYSFAFPILDEDGNWAGQVGGFHLFALDSKLLTSHVYTDIGKFKIIKKSRYSWNIRADDLNYLANINRQDITYKELTESLGKAQTQKYNYSNILAEFKDGEERQSPFKYFNKVFVDQDYNRSLLGPFSIINEVQRIEEDQEMLTADPNLNITGIPDIEDLFATEEGSLDRQRLAFRKDFANWDSNALTFDEKAISVTHIVENPNVNSVFVSLQLNSLSDTVSETIKKVNVKKNNDSDDTLNAGTKYPAVLNVRIEIGKITAQGTEEPLGFKDFQITALVESAAVIDIGNPDSASLDQDTFQYISNIENNNAFEGDVFTPFLLPTVNGARTQEDGAVIIPQADGEETPVKRYVTVTKLSTETNSILINKSVSLLKVTEIIPVNLSYPFSSIAGLKIDSRTFSSIPQRTYDCKLKKIQIPSNYYPIYEDGRDKRYYNTVEDFDNTNSEGKQIYKSDWDGNFVEGWTDNPAWILYDLLTSSRYGLGQYLDASQINKWELYKIARFCDAIDDDGNFVGVSDGRGGLEPRYSCNVLFSEGTKVFDAINVVASLFRGAVFYGGSEINFLDDRIKDPIALFSNSNVKDGIFSYSNYRRDEQFNAIEVIYIDRFDNYKTKVEYIEEAQDIAQRGLFKKEINALGVTSKAMARRIGQHFIYQTINENQSVAFSAGLESLLCKPGDLVIVEDELKTLSTNYGRVLDVDPIAGYVRIDQAFDSGEFQSGIVLYTPTGLQNSADLDSLVLGRTRLTDFEITGSPNVSFDPFISPYVFSGYTAGFTGDSDDIYPLQNQYALYTGEGVEEPIIYYDTTWTGWVFATGSGFTTGNQYNKFITKELDLVQFLDLNSTNPSIVDADKIDTYLNTAIIDPRTTPQYSLSDKFLNNSGQLSRINQGILDNEIALNSTPQITTLSTTGTNNLDYGSRIYIDSADSNFAILSRIPVGSAYKINRLNADDQIYKIISIKEENANEYSLIANLYHTGKFDTIENNISIDLPSDTFGYGNNNLINGVNYDVLDAPVWTILTTGAGLNQGIGFSLTFTGDLLSTGYSITMTRPNTRATTKSATAGVTKLVTFGDTEENGYTEPGIYQFSVVALGDSSSNLTQRYFDSNYSVTGYQYFETLTADETYDNTTIGDWGIR